MAKELNFLTGSSSTRLTDINDANYVSITPGSVYFTTDGKIYFDLDSATRLWMGQNAQYATSAGAFASARKIQLTGGITGSAESTGAGGWTIKTTVTNDGHTHDTQYIRLDGTNSPMTGVLSLVANANADTLTGGALNLQGSNINKVNTLYFNASAINKGIQFLRTDTADDGTALLDALYAVNGTLYFAPKRTLGSATGTGHPILTSNNYNTYAAARNGHNASGDWGINITGNSATATKLTSSAGDATHPVYFSDGKPVKCSDTIANSTTGNAATATKLKTACAINGTDFDGSADITTKTWGPTTTFVVKDNSGTNAVAGVQSTGGGTINLLLPATIKATLTGTADKAKALTTTTAGSTTKPVYFTGGIPKVCDNSLAVDITGKAATAGTADALKGFALTIGKLQKTITGSTAAEYSLASIGAVANTGDEITGDLTIDPDNGSFIGNLNGTAAIAIKLGTSTVGGAGTPIYLKAGVPTACTGPLDIVALKAQTMVSTNVGGSAQAMYLNSAGMPTPITATVGSGVKPMYMESGTFMASSSNVGTTAQPIYMVNGVLTAISATVGSASKPVYLNKGVITECTAELSGGHADTADSAGKWTTARQFTIGKAVLSVDGSTNREWTSAAITGHDGATGIAPVVNGTIPSTYLPSYVDDVVEGYYISGKFYTANSASSDKEMAAMGGIIYVDLNTNKTYRYSGSAYVVISETLAVGTATGTALDGAIGTAHINNKQNPHQVTYSQIYALGTQTTSAQTVASAVTFKGKITASGGIAGNLTGNVTGNLTGSVTGNADTATKLKTARSINGTAFDGSADITTAKWGTTRSLTIGLKAKDVNGSQAVSWSLSEIGAVAKAGDTMTGTLNINGNNGTTGLAVRRNSSDTEQLLITVNDGQTIFNYTNDEASNSFVFQLVNTDTESSDGSNANTSTVTFAGASGKSTVTATTFKGALSGNASTATKLAAARAINGTNFDGSQSITTAKWGTARDISIADSSKTNTGTAVSVDGSAATTLLLPATIKATLTGNASTATKLATARKVNGTAFDGSADITTAIWGTARTITIGKTEKSVNGSANVAWSLEDIAEMSDVTTYTASLSLTTDWQNVFTSNNATKYLAKTGTYVVQVYIADNSTDGLSHWYEYYSGVMSWYVGSTNSTDADEILLHKAGHASNANNIYLRTIRNTSGYLALQISANKADSDTTTKQSIQFKFRRLI